MAPPHLVMRQAVGNQAVLRLNADGHKASGLTISRPDDRYEREADALAEQAVAEQDNHSPGEQVRPAMASRHIQRVAYDVSPSFDDATVVEGEQEAPAQQEEQPPMVQMKAEAGSDGAEQPPPGWETALDSSLHHGRPLEPELREEMSARLGADFGAVRVHLDSESETLSRTISARAFTRGQHVFFAPGEYHPDTASGRKVIAHELAHVIQQGGAGPDRPAGATAQPEVRRLHLESPPRVVRSNVSPWYPPNRDPRGDDYAVTTDGGSSIAGWVALAGYPEPQRYWCHGYSLGTYASDGYSVYSGTSMQQVIQDEFQPMTIAIPRPGDIFVRLQDPNSSHIYDHSAVVYSVSAPNNVLDENATMLNTKNGAQPLKSDTLAGVRAVYPGSYGFFRHN